MIDKRIGKRLKQRREELGLTQEDLAEKLGLTPNYISTVERGASFPRCEKLILLLNGLEDVLTHSAPAKASILSEQITELPSEEQQRILNMVELMIKQAKEK